MKWVACAESAVEIFANGQVRLSGRASTRTGTGVRLRAGCGRGGGAAASRGANWLYGILHETLFIE